MTRSLFEAAQRRGLASRRWSKKTATGDDVGRRLNLIGLVIIIGLRPPDLSQVLTFFKDLFAKKADTA